MPPVQNLTNAYASEICRNCGARKGYLRRLVGIGRGDGISFYHWGYVLYPERIFKGAHRPLPQESGYNRTTSAVAVECAGGHAGAR